MIVEKYRFPDDLLYTPEHLWVKVEGTKARVGVTDLGQSLAKEIVHVDLPLTRRYVKRRENVASFETIKAVMKIPSPFSGRISEVNASLVETPEVINKDPYGAGWLFTIALEDAREIRGLMPVREAKRYFRQFIKREREKYGS